ncbi:hypothetical protein A1O3_03515 [Capronia epimyces CBS 606.96]|uniref:Uncharacterized protein n=1 Tax=Capronia epimyces CBS 606.96 TaxID=1182542 RepID=W9Y173_9EURO|nr:uncharacterized protein A1O3_03515 [Capronia epimyces CBS 606.96]EXJ86562.1 hypothetical protein A1O3_03515 [Capronia epimyces CBS 606.96]
MCSTPNHLLVLRAISQPRQPDPAKKYTSARLVSRQRLGRSRGSLVATLTLPCGPGLWPAFWLLPAEPFSWPTDGEVDIAETWNSTYVNHSCLHWGHYVPQDLNKHRVCESVLPGLQQRRPVRFEFAWQQDENENGTGRLLWWIDGRAVMKNTIPQGIRRLADFTVILNIAMAGQVCQGQEPPEGAYDFVVHDLKMQDTPDGGWGRFDSDWSWVKEGEVRF